MTQADSVHSTPPINTPIVTTRRRFLSTAAGIAAAGTALALAAPPARAATDPVFALIEAHRAAAAAWDGFLKAHGHLQQMPDEEEALCDTAMGALSV